MRPARTKLCFFKFESTRLPAMNNGLQFSLRTLFIAVTVVAVLLLVREHLEVVCGMAVGGLLGVRMGRLGGMSDLWLAAGIGAYLAAICFFLAY